MRPALNPAFVAGGKSANLACADWIDHRGLETPDPQGWYVEISISTDRDDTRCELNVYPDEWEVIFRRGLRVSSIRVTDAPRARGRDDDDLLRVFPTLDHIRNLLTLLEHRFDIEFDRTAAAVHSNLTRATPIVRSWLVERVR
jgi:hypothetical protein